MKVTIVSQKKLSEEQLFALGKKHGFGLKDAQNVTDESIKSGVLLKIGEEVIVDSIDDVSNVVTLISSRELSKDILEKVAKKFSVEMNAIHTKIDESILGGIIIKHKDRLFDGSVRAELEDLRLKLAK